MAFSLDADVGLAAASAVLLTAFAITVGWIGRFRGPPLWFAMFEGGFGLTAALSNFMEGFVRRHDDPVLRAPWLNLAFQFPILLTAGIGAAGLLLLAHRFPRPLLPAERRSRVWALAPLVLLCVAIYPQVAAAIGATPVPASALQIVGFTINAGGFEVLRGLMWGTVLLLALRYRNAKDSADRSRMALMAAAVSIYPSMYGAWTALPDAAHGKYPEAWEFWVTILVVAMMAAAWLRCARGPGAAAARNVVLVILSAPLIGMLVSAVNPEFSPSFLARLAAILILAFAVLRHQMLGLDVKVRFAIKTSTIAAVFLAVLFVVANIAQNYLGGTYGIWVGGAAAGMLFFAMSPIQRAAERLSEKAVPIAAAAGVAVPSSTASNSDDLYRRALRLALSDRRLTTDEELTLAELSEHFGLGHRRALELRHDVDRELVRSRRKGT